MILVRQLGLLKYSEALALMEEKHTELVSDPSAGEAVLIVEHPPVVTMGLRERSSDLVTSESTLGSLGIDFRKIDRGGSVTVHEPGQLVLYPLVRVDARFLTVRKLVWALEEIMIRECSRWGLTAGRDDINPGVWVGRNKIGAVGVRVSNHVSKHGLALNVQNTLETFGHIVPCGIQGRGVTSLKQASSAAIKDNLPLIGSRMAADFIGIIEEFRCPSAAVPELCIRTDVAPL
jgi:lipoate-protein ligase B